MKKYITKQSSIKGAGKGLFTKESFKKGEVIGLAHVDDQPASEIGRNHNHNEKNPTAYSKKINNKRFIYASKDLKPGEEITTNYRMQPELEQPEDFMRKGGSVLRLPNKKNSKGYSRSLSATNKLFTENFLFAKPKSRKNKVFDPNSKYYAEGGALLTKEVTCKKCGWQWDAADGGNDVTTCHKCGGQGLVHAQDGGESGCPKGYYYNGKICVKLSKNAFATSDPDEYAFRKAAYDDSLWMYQNNKRNPWLWKALKHKKNGNWLQNAIAWSADETISNKKNFTLTPQQFEKGYKAKIKKDVITRFSNNTGITSLANALYDQDHPTYNSFYYREPYVLTPEAREFDSDHSPIRRNNPSIPFNEPISYLGKKATYTDNLNQSGERVGYIETRYKKPVQPVVYDGSDKKPVKVQKKVVSKQDSPTTRTVYIDCPPGSVSNDEKTEVITHDPDSPGNYLRTITTGCKPEKIENLQLLKPGLIDPTKDELQGNTLNEEKLELPNEEVESEYLEEGSPDTENAMEWVDKRKYNIDWNGIQIPYRLPRFRKPGSYGDLIKPGKKRYINLPTIESRNTAYLREEQDGGITKLTPKEEKQFQNFYKTLPNNLQSDDDTYDIRGYWDSEQRPTEFDYTQPKDKDGFYHAYSINGNTGEYLKSPAHPTFQHAVDEDRKIGYRPITNVQGRNIAIENKSIADPEEQSFLRNTEGPINYIEAELDEDEIEEYRRGGYIVEEIDTFQKGGISKVSSNSSDNTRVNYQKPLVKSFNRSNNLESFYKKERKKDLQKQKDATAYHDKTQKVKQNQSFGEFINQDVLGIPTLEEQTKQVNNDKKLLKKELKPYFETEKEIDQFISQQYSRPTASAENNWNDGPIQMVYPEKYFIGPSGGIIGNIKNLGKNTFNLGKKVLSNPYVSGGLNAYFGTEGIKEFADPNSLTRKSMSRAYNNPTGSNIGDAAFDVGINSLNFIGLPFNKAIKGSKNLINNTYKINPWAFKANPEAYYRMIGKEGYKDALESGVIRPPQYSYITPQGMPKVGEQSVELINGRLQQKLPIPAYDDAYYNAQYPLDRRWYPNSIKKTNPEKAAIAQKSGYQGPYMAEVTGQSQLFENGENVASYFGPNSSRTVTYSKEHIPISNPNLKFYKEHWLKGYKEVPKQLPGSPNVDFSKYLTQEEAIAARAERLISQKNKPGWNEQLTPELEQRLSTAVERHNPASDYPGEKLGSNTMGRTATEVSKDANLSGIPLNEANKARIAAHETGHYYSNSSAEGAEWLKPFNLNKLESYKTKTYLRGKNRSANYANEIRERAAQLKDYIAQKNGIPLNQDFKITQVQLDDAIKNYVKDTGLDNTMSKMLGALNDKKGLLKTMNKYALGTVPVIIGAETLQQKKQGGTSNDYVDVDLTPEEIKDLIAQGYVIEELN